MRCVNQTTERLLWEFKVRAAYWLTGSANTLVDYACTYWLTASIHTSTSVDWDTSMLADWHITCLFDWHIRRPPHQLIQPAVVSEPCCSHHPTSMFIQVPTIDPNCTGNRCEHGLCRCHKVRSSPAVMHDGSVLFGSYDFNIYKLDLNGNQLWVVPTQGAVYGPVSVDVDGMAFVGSFDGFLYSISQDGQVNWKFPVGAHGDVGWALGQGKYKDLVLGQANEGGVCTSWPPPDCPVPDPSPGGGHCFAYAVHKQTGKLVWKYKTGAPGGGGLIVDDMFIIGNWNQNVTAFAIETGRVLWQFNTTGEIESHPAYHDGVVFVSSEESKTMFALNVSTGKLLWKYDQAAEEFNGSPSVTLDTVYVGSNDHYLHAVDRVSGAAAATAVLLLLLYFDWCWW